MLRKVKITDELNKSIEYITGSIPAYPKGGSQGLYTGEVIDKLATVKNGQSIRLFFILCLGSNEHGLVTITRREMAHALNVHYDASNMSKMLLNLEDAGLIAKMSNTYLINPFIVLPKTKSPKMKSTIQEVWSMQIEFN